MRLTRGADYGIRSILYLARQSGEQAVLLREISQAEGVPQSFLAKIFHTLAKAGLVKSRRGTNGGFFLARPAQKITLKELVEALEGTIALNICLIRKEECDRSDVCPVYTIWREAQDRMVEVLERTTVAELVERLEPAQERRSRR
jgi:Rrf2 family iron-sulfur cluster assembly transcriptional regulator